ncbi:hypothetical protein TUM19329_12480 [Legionella antarctica]|uniref:HEPN AbiJ-N-terminal domain-containing protein n=1 Tax=Legionella antarctica TaxID=2708020 RepID=A0A6F8T3Z5_9GAMM|nr:hypothetical protein [Legionella antarctica]BCA94887.1 hypothetical protein TUM19329_12480 [Legionella antarctica]
MSNFSTRKGLAIRVFQQESINTKLMTSLWNCIFEIFKENIKVRSFDGSCFWTEGMLDAVQKCWTDFFYCEYDNFPMSPTNFINAFKSKFFKLKWNEVYDLLEFLAETLPESFKKKCNLILEKEYSAYRFVGSAILEIINGKEILSVESAMQSPFYLVNEHIEKAVKLLSNKENPDVQNSIKESISAIEALIRIITKNKKGTLGDLMNHPNLQLHPSLKEGIKKFYGFASDQGGIRHSNKENSISVGYSDALFKVVFCSSFINYMISKLGDDNLVASQ